MMLLRLVVCAVLFAFTPVHAQDAPALVVEFGGLKNTYRVVFEQFDDANHFASGAFEILGDDDGREKPHTRIPFSAEVKPDAKDKKTEVLEVRCTAGVLFFPPADKKEAYPPLTWKLTGRQSGKPVLKLKLWQYDADKDSWVLDEMELEKPE